MKTVIYKIKHRLCLSRGLLILSHLVALPPLNGVSPRLDRLLY